MNLIIEYTFKITANNAISIEKKSRTKLVESVVSNNKTLRDNFHKIFASLCPSLKYAVTLSMKQVATLKNKHSVYKQKAYLNESIAKDQLKYFTQRLIHYAYGNEAKRKSTKDNCIPIIIPSLEGQRTDSDKFKRMHWHLAIGNLPEMTLAEAATIILRAWNDCDFAYKENKVINIYDADGWVKYLRKGLYSGDTFVIEFENFRYPQTFALQEIKYLQTNQNWSVLELDYSK